MLEADSKLKLKISPDEKVFITEKWTDQGDWKRDETTERGDGGEVVTGETVWALSRRDCWVKG